MATGDSDGLPEERAAKRARQWYSLWSEACEKAGRPGAARAGATLAAHDAACRKGAAPAVPVAVRSPGGAVTALATPVAVAEASADAGAVAVASCCFNQANDPSHEVPALHAVPATHLELALPPPSPQWGASRYSEGTLLLRNPSSDSEVAFAATVEDADGGRTPGAIAVLSPQVGLVPCCATGAGVAPASVPLSFSRTAQGMYELTATPAPPPPSTHTHVFGTLSLLRAVCATRTCARSRRSRVSSPTPRTANAVAVRVSVRDDALPRAPTGGAGGSTSDSAASPTGDTTAVTLRVLSAFTPKEGELAGVDRGHMDAFDRLWQSGARDAAAHARRHSLPGSGDAGGKDAKYARVAVLTLPLQARVR